ncbi:CBS domain-containing protein [Candidatus Bathyarchaeota archaeon]|nr:CBS domain-containing protein [Candidatus Bathyarchaeota archaeon]
MIAPQSELSERGTSNLSEKDITKFLQVLGLSKREIQVYMFLSRSGVQSTSFVARKLKMERVQAYRTFRKLQEKGLIEATLERPTRFTIVPFETLLDAFINSKKSEVAQLIERKEDLISTWNAISSPESTYPVAKFSVVTGKKKIHTKMCNMIEDSAKEVLILTTSLGLIQEDIAGVFDKIIDPAQKRHVNFQIITDISEKNLNILERINNFFSDENVDVKIRHLNMDSKFFPRFLIKDEMEAILYAPVGEEKSMLKLEDEGLWINDKMFISILRAFFDQMWHSSVEVSRRVDELKTGIPMGETVVIKDPADAWAKITKVLETAKKDIILIASSQSINNLLENDPFRKYCKKDTKCRIMASIDLDNLETAQKLSVRYQVKHVPISYLTMMIIDNKHLFMFKKPSLNETVNENGFYLVDTFYSNDPSSTERVGEMLNDIWKRGVEISEISSQAGIRMPSVEVSVGETVSKLMNKMLQNGVNSIMVTENQKTIGIINDRELLREIFENQKDPERTLVKDIEYTPLVMLDSDESITSALKLMREKGMKRVAVVKNGQLVGMLTEDLAKKEIVPMKT